MRRVTWQRLGLLSGATACSVAMFAPVPALAGVEVGSRPIAFTTVNPCTGEQVFFEGVVHFVDGTHFRWDVSGVGSSGATYRFFSIDNEVSGRSRSASQQESIVGTQRIVREGGSGDDDWFSHSTAHFTSDANGVPRVDFSSGNFGCG